LINRIHLGDSRDILKQIPDQFVDLVVTDCPYKIKTGGARIEIEGEGENQYKKTDPKGVLARPSVVRCKDKLKNAKWLKQNDINNQNLITTGSPFLQNDIKFEEWLPDLFRILKNGSHSYIMINSQNLKDLQVQSEKAGFIFQNLLIWKKNNATPNKYYMQQCEFILMLRKGRAKNVNDMGIKNLFEIPNIIGDKLHPTEKPVELMQIMIEQSSNKGNLVIDPFCGAGSTLVACLKTHRNFIGIELEEQYFQIAQKRILQVEKPEDIENKKQLSIF